MAARLDLIIEKGSTFSKVFIWKTKDSQSGQLTPVDLTGYKARLQVREDYDSSVVLFNLTTENGLILIEPLLGKITVSIPSDYSTPVASSYGVWDIELYQDSYVKRLLEGRVKLTPEVTK